MQRNKRSRNLVLAAAIGATLLPYGKLPGFALAFTPDGNEGDTTPGSGGDDTVAGDGGAPRLTGPKPKRTYTETEFVGVVRQRDRSKEAFKALLRSLGRDPEAVEIVETGDPDEPFRVEGEEIDELRELASKAAGEAATPKSAEAKRRIEEQRRKRIVGPVQRKLDAANRRNAALVSWIQENAVAAPLRLACRDEEIVDDDDGQFADVVELLSKRFVVRVDLDEDDPTSDVVVTLDTVDGEGQPIRGADGEPLTPREMVADLAKKKPKFRKSGFRPGTGAGGHVAAARAAGANGNGNGSNHGNRPAPRGGENPTVKKAAANYYGVPESTFDQR
jgi:hypothetical protein